MIYEGDSRDILPTLPTGYIDCVVTSPPYWQLRDYEHPNQIGLENSPKDYINNLINIFEKSKPLLKESGTLWVNLGDKYSGSHNGKGSFDKKWKNARCCPDSIKTTWNDVDIGKKNLMGLPWRFAFAMQDAGWTLRQDIIWYKPNAMPSGASARGRFGNSYEHVFFFVKNADKYYFDAESVKEPSQAKIKENRAMGIERAKSEKYNSKYEDTRQSYCSKTTIFGGKNIAKKNINKICSGKVYASKKYRLRRDVWCINTQSFKGKHYACFPEELARTCILAGCPIGGGLY